LKDFTDDLTPVRPVQMEVYKSLQLMKTGDYEQALSLQQNFNIDEVPPSDGDEDESIVNGGSIEIWTPDYAEEKKLRPFIATIIVIVWGIGIIASAVRAFMTGDVLIVVPPAVITVPLMTVLRFYFGNDNDQKEKGYGNDKNTKYKYK
jgi:hypothetical protein